MYLDIYQTIPHPETGEPTRREFLGLYLLDKAKTVVNKQHNKETQNLAVQIRQKRDNQLNKPEIYSGYEKEQLKIREKGKCCFVQYFKKLAAKRKFSNYDNWVSSLHYLESFTKGSLKFADRNESVCEDFKDYLIEAPSKRSNKTTLSINSTVSYFNKFKATLKQAFKDGYLQSDLNSKISPIKAEETQRKFLTIEEANSLYKTDCSLPVLKQAALFSILRGLRFSDIKKITWGEIEFITSNGYFIHFRQQKTEDFEVMPIFEQAFALLGERKEPNTKVFQDLIYSDWTNRILAKWLNNAGITKDITFHSFRYTYATLQLSKGTSLFTVSKMLGHRDIKTTQIYAKIVDQTKREATNKIVLDLQPL